MKSNNIKKTLINISRYAYIIAFIVFITALYSCTNSSGNKNTASNNVETKINKGKPIIKFEEQDHDFGKIFQGEKVSYVFKFKNIGTSDLIIKDAITSCGCTVPKYPNKPIAPGETGEIEAIFNSSGRYGKQVKKITVWTNCEPDQTPLLIRSEILEIE